MGGGIKTLEDIRLLLKYGADKISINTSAVENPSLVKEAAEEFGSQCIVVAIDAKRENDSWQVYVYGGRKPAGLDAIEWAKKVADLGAGEILLTSIDKDGTKDGYDLELTKRISLSVDIPIIASGGAGTPHHFYEVFKKTKASAALAASIFHYGEYSIKEIKRYLKERNIEVRLD